MPLIIKVISLNENCEKVGFAKICRLACFVERTMSHLEWAGEKLNNAVLENTRTETDGGMRFSSRIMRRPIAQPCNGM